MNGPSIEGKIAVDADQIGVSTYPYSLGTVIVVAMLLVNCFQLLLRRDCSRKNDKGRNQHE